MRRVLLMAMALSACLASAQIKSDCSPPEKKILEQVDFRNQFVLHGALSAVDCTPVKAGARELLFVNVVANTKSGLESSVAIYDRLGFNEKAGAVFKSPPLGFDTFPILVNGVQRLAFVHPSSDKNRLVFYMSTQTGPAATRLARWELFYDKKEVTESTRTWSFEAGILAKIYQDKDTWRALIDIRSVEL